MREILQDIILRNVLELKPAEDLQTYLEQGGLILEHIDEFELKKINVDSKELALV